MRAAWPWVLSGATLLVAFNVATMLLPLVLGAFIDEIITPLVSGTNLSLLLAPLLLWGGAIVVLYLVMHLGYRFGGRLGWFGVQRTQHELTLAVMERILRTHSPGTRQHSPGETLSIATGDVHRASLVIYLTVYPPGEVVGLAVAIWVLCSVDPWLGLGSLCALPLVVIMLHRAARPLLARSLSEQGGMADAAAAAADSIEGYRVLRGIHAETRAADRYRSVSRSAMLAAISARNAAALFEGISASAAQLFAATIAAVAAWMAAAGRIGVGEFIAVAGVAVMLIDPLDGLVSTVGKFWARSQASAHRVLSLWSEAEQVPGGLGSRGQCVMELQDGLTVMTTDQVSAGVFATECAERGRSNMLVPPHAPGIFAGTVRENVAAGCNGDETATARTIVSALEAAALFEHELPGGYDAEAGPNGRFLSGGQRQRVALARALAADPDILVLTEPTTSVDAVTEQGIAQSLRRYRSGRRTAIITNSSAFAAIADRQLRLGGTDTDTCTCTCTDECESKDHRD